VTEPTSCTKGATGTGGARGVGTCIRTCAQKGVLNLVCMESEVRTALRAPQAQEEPGRLGRLILPTLPLLSMEMWGKLKNTADVACWRCALIRNEIRLSCSAITAATK